MLEENLTIIWITRKNENEDRWLKEYLKKFNNYKFKKIVVGFCSLEEKIENFKYIPFWENGIDEMGLLCHKKNLGVKNTETENLLILHSDCYPSENFFDAIKNINFLDDCVYAPIGFIEGTQKRGFTWCIEKHGDRNKDPDEPVNDITYISGAAIMGKTQIFKNNPWNENLKHNQGEDVELSKRMKKNNIILKCAKEVSIIMKNDR